MANLQHRLLQGSRDGFKLSSAQTIHANRSRRSRAQLCIKGSLGRRAVLNGVCCSNCLPSLGRMGWYDKFFAYAMATGMGEHESAVAPIKNQLFDLVWLDNPDTRDVLDLGIGAGPNLKYIQPREGSAKVHVTGLDPNSQMFPYVNAEVERVGLLPDQLDIKQGVAENIPLPDASVDLCISTLVLCSVNDVPKVVEEVHRVLRPGGHYIFLEHVIASKDRPGLRLAQQALTPLQQLFADGCHLNRNPLSSIEQKLEMKVVQEFTVPGLGIIGPHVAGVAVRGM